MDFIKVYTRESKNNSKNRDAGATEVFIDFKVFNSKDLMTRGRSFYAIYNPNATLWSRNEMSVVELVDAEIRLVDKEGRKACHLWINGRLSIWKLAEVCVIY